MTASREASVIVGLLSDALSHLAQAETSIRRALAHDEAAGNVLGSVLDPLRVRRIGRAVMALPDRATLQMYRGAVDHLRQTWADAEAAERAAKRARS